MDNEQKWSKEPWIGAVDGHYPSMKGWHADDESDMACCSEAAAIHDSRGNVVALVVDSDEEYFRESPILGPNHARIVACVNFLSAHPDLSKVEVVSKEDYAKLMASHAELLEALNRVVGRIEVEIYTSEIDLTRVYPIITNAEAIK